jgi:hypothetical protein
MCARGFYFWVKKKTKKTVEFPKHSSTFLCQGTIDVGFYFRNPFLLLQKRVQQSFAGWNMIPRTRGWEQPSPTLV